MKLAYLSFHVEPKKLKLLNVIGQGGFGTVYRAVWQGVVVAAKIIPAQKDVTSKEADVLKYVYYTAMIYIIKGFVLFVE